MSTFAVQIYKNTGSNKPPTIHLPPDLPPQELKNGQLITVAQNLFAEHGVLVIKNLFAQDLIGQLQQAFFTRYQPYFTEQDNDDALKVGDKRKMLTVDFQPPFSQPAVYGNPLLLSIMHGLLGPNFVLGSFGAVIALPGAEGQHIHRDHPSLFEDQPNIPPLPSFAITVVVPLVELTAETGSTRVWKGSHRVAGDQKLPMKDSAVPYMAIGSCYLMDYQLLHGGTPNISAEIVRPILYIIYYRSWFQEAVNYDQQSRLALTPSAYDDVPRPYRFLFTRQREIIQGNQVLAQQSQRRSTQTQFVDLAKTEQKQQLTKLAETVLPQYGFKQAHLELISHGDNTVFAVRGIGDKRNQGDRAIFRIHRAHYLTTQAVESELHWLNELHDHSPIRVPKPLPTVANTVCSTAQILGMTEPRTCSLTGWLAGRSLLALSYEARSQPQLLTAIGQLLAQLHNHAAQWTSPELFTRPCWNWDGLFGSGAGYSDAGDRVWALTPEPYRQCFADIGEQVKTIMVELGETPDQFGLIHGDFWLGNLLIEGDDIGVIDFADCGFGYWGYDLARFLNDFATETDYSPYLDALLQGYRQVRAFPQAQLLHFPLFLAAQQVTLALWRVNRAQAHPSFRATLAADLEETMVTIETFSTL